MSTVCPKSKQAHICRTLQLENVNLRFLCSGVNAWTAELDQPLKHKIESHWKIKVMHEEYSEASKNEKMYVLSMFPYPSGNLHMGHVRVYVISDSIARFHRMNGKNVLQPMGWDAFGLPAENAAIERGVSADAWTKDNIATMRQQLKQLGCTLDWSRELATCDPEYYRFTQYIFLKLFENGLAYKKKALVNWDPIDQTVLADEQVDENGCSWRSGAKVEKKVLSQWFIKTTAFAKSLYDGLESNTLEDWRDIIKLQKHWIGECNGASFEFLLIDSVSGKTDMLNVWTAKSEHLNNVKCICVAPGSIIDRECEGEGRRKLQHVVAVNPLTNEKIPVYITDAVQYEEGRDNKLIIPGLYEDDCEFLKSVDLLALADKNLCDNEMERKKIIAKLNGNLTSSKIRDWLISRQRFWGTPIPIVNCEKCGEQPIPYEELPVTLPPFASISQKGSSHLKATPEWIQTSCPKCNGPAQRDTDTMDTFVDSSWYFLRYTDPHNTELPFRKDLANKLMPVDIYIGGKEHAVLHLYYARFMNHFLHSIGWISEPEPFRRLLVQGMVMGKSYRVKSTGRYLKQDEIDFSGKKPVEAETHKPLVETWEKMSKSKYNGVNPNDMFSEYGIDVTRLLILADVAPFTPRNWDKSTFPGIINWQRRLWLTVQAFREARAGGLPKPPDMDKHEASLWDSRNYYTRQTTYSYSVSHQLSTAIRKMQGLTNDLRKHSAETMAHSGEFERALAVQVIMLAPIAPHFASELWVGMQTAQGRIDKVKGEIDWSKPVLQQTWPVVDSNYLLSFECAINRAIKCELKLPRKDLDLLTVESALQLALDQPAIQEYTFNNPVLGTNWKFYPGLYAYLDIAVDHTKIKQAKRKAAA